jgi:molecular chaperone Hsp33
MSDRAVRAMTDDGAFRVIAATTTSTVLGAAAAQTARGPTLATFGDLLTGAILVRETMAPDLRVQGILKGSGESGGLVADSHPDGTTRGLVQLRKGKTAVVAGDGAVLQMMRTMPNGSLHQGIVEVPERGGIPAALMAYMQLSEQVDTVIAVATLTDGDNVVAAGGYVVQLLPEAEREALAQMTEHLSSLDALPDLLRAAADSPETLVERLLVGMPFSHLDTRPLRFECQCSEERVWKSLSTLSRRELEEMRDERKVFEISCDFCRKVYEVGPDELSAIMDIN